MDTLIISLLAQKGGVCKSFLTKLIAVVLAKLGFNVLIADMDIAQKTTYRWSEKRKREKILPHVTVKSYHSVKDAKKDIPNYDFVIFDGLPSTGDETSKKKTIQMGEMSNLIIIPGSSSIEDMQPQIELAHELVKEGVEKERVLFCMVKMSDSKAIKENAMEYLQKTGYQVIPHVIPFRDTYHTIALEGKAGSETRFESLNKKCINVVQYIANYMDL